MNKKGFKHLALVDRQAIQFALDEGNTCKMIALSLGFDDRSISREIKHYRKKIKNGRYGIYNKFDDTPCKTLLRFPYVCNACSRKAHCFKEFKYTYDASYANNNSLKVLRDSRLGLDILPEDKEIFDNILIDGVKKGQSIHHIIQSNKDKMRYSERNTYRLIEKGLTPIHPSDLPRKAKLKPRKHYNYTQDCKTIRQGRTYIDFLKFWNSNACMSVTEIDTVLATRTKGHKCLLTIHISATHFMLIFVLDDKSKDNVSNAFRNLQLSLGYALYQRIFPVVLTDRGTEFCDPLAIEQSSNGDMLTNLFYCDSYSSYQKGAIEENHTLLRRIIPKNTLFDSLSQEQANIIASHINSYRRHSLGGETPIKLTRELFGDDFLAKVNITEILDKDVILKHSLIK